MSRKPHYSTNTDCIYRVISGPNGSWLVQKRIGEKGTRELDYWQTEYATNDLNEAKKVLM